MSEWRFLSDEEIADRRRSIPKGVERRFPGAKAFHTFDDEGTEAVPGGAAFAKPPPTRIVDARQAQDNMHRRLVDWWNGAESRAEAQRMVRTLRAMNPEACRHLTDDQLASQIVNDMRAKTRRAVEAAWKRNPQWNKWDRGVVIGGDR